MPRPQLAVVLTSYGPTSHGLCICTKLLEGLAFEDHVEPPRCDVVAMHLVQVAADDIGVATAARHGVPLYPSVAEALCRGGDTLAVDGVVIVGEHGDFPRNELGQKLYPRRELFDQVVDVFRASGRVVPVFNDKHLSWNRPWALGMWRTAQELAIPFMAGSSLPYASFEPAVELPGRRRVGHMVAAGYGPVEDYGFHALETAQFVIEQRAGGERGVRRVRCLSGEAVWQAQRAGAWPEAVAEVVTGLAWDRWAPVRGHDRLQSAPADPPLYAFDVEHCDGQRVTVLLVDDGVERAFGFGVEVEGLPGVTAAAYRLDPVPRLTHFSAMVRAMEDMFLTGRPPVPVERTVLTTGVLSYVMESRHLGGVTLDTPDLHIPYRWRP